MTNRLDELERLLGEAHPLPWKVATGSWDDKKAEYCDAALTVAAVNALPDLLAVCRAAGELRGAVDVFGGGRNVPKLVARFDGALLRLNGQSCQTCGSSHPIVMAGPGYSICSDSFHQSPPSEEGS